MFFVFQLSWAFIKLPQILTGAVPYAHLKQDHQVLLELVRGKTPARPKASEYITDDLWQLITHCWKRDPVGRPKMRSVFERVAQFKSETIEEDVEMIDISADETQPSTQSPASVGLSSSAGCIVVESPI